MATIKYQLQSKKDNSQIYLRLSFGRGKYSKPKTGLFINFSDWNVNKGYPKPNTPENKKPQLTVIKT